MRNLKQYGLQELTLIEIRRVEGGALNFTLMHIYAPKYPEIKVWRPKLNFSELLLWS